MIADCASGLIILLESELVYLTAASECLPREERVIYGLGGKNVTQTSVPSVVFVCYKPGGRGSVPIPGCSDGVLCSMQALFPSSDRNKNPSLIQPGVSF